MSECEERKGVGESCEGLDDDAYVYEKDGVLMLVDPQARQVARVVGKHNCAETFRAHAESIARFRQRVVELGRTDVVIVVLSMNDPYGAVLGDALMPGQGALWQSIREEGKVPYARGIAERSGVFGILKEFDPEAAAKLEALGGVGVLVIDYTVAEVYP